MRVSPTGPEHPASPLEMPVYRMEQWDKRKFVQDTIYFTKIGEGCGFGEGAPIFAPLSAGWPQPAFWPCVFQPELTREVMLLMRC